MIPPQTVAQIIDAADIEDVVGNFVDLKPRGSNRIGLCPFHNEKTPSFSVSPSKGIYKCFGCGKAGSAVNFLMEHEKYTYPEALRWLGERYNIEIQEIESKEGKEQKKARDSLFLINEFARDYFIQNLMESDEGRKIGLSYFKERGYREEIIKKFELGYAMDSFEALTNTASDKSYNLDLLLKLGLIKQKETRKYDFFRGRVMFPIHNLSGKVLAFAGRVLKKDPKAAKYVNSPESDIYNKSAVLYGMFQARRAIREQDRCLLVEGYTDVLSLFQAGIENAVASSGTSLTVDQIRLINRFTPNVTMLYDGDSAGVKAALRGVDLILEQGLNVRIAQLPDGEDPDSYVRKVGAARMQEYLSNDSKDFILFKANLLLKEAEGDPIKKAGVVNSIVESISLIPDPIKRSIYIKECSSLLDVSEEAIANASNKQRSNKRKKRQQSVAAPTEQPSPTAEAVKAVILPENPNAAAKVVDRGIQVVERELLEVLIRFGHTALGESEEKVADILRKTLDQFPPKAPLYLSLYELYTKEMDEGRYREEGFFFHHQESLISKIAVDVCDVRADVSENWEKKHRIFTPKEEEKLDKRVMDLVNRYRLLCLQDLKAEKEAEMMRIHKEDPTSDEIRLLMGQCQQISTWISELSNSYGTVIHRERK